MGVHHIAAVAEIDGLTASRKAVLYSLAIASNLDGEWKLDRRVLQRMCGLSERALRDNLSYLKRWDYLQDLGGDYLRLEL